MYLWTSEAVAAGHPDKVADQIADAILDKYLSLDPNSRVACEVLVTKKGSKGIVILTGEISTKDIGVDLTPVVYETLARIGYNLPEYGFSEPEVMNFIREQSPEIAHAVVKDDGELGAGDQGLMFGFACAETPTMMPLAHYLAFQIIKSIEKSSGGIFQPDAKSQVTVQYDDDGNPKRVDSVVVSVCHNPSTTVVQAREAVLEILNSKSFLDCCSQDWKKNLSELFDDNTKYYINPAGEWHVGGPAADTGLSGRKIVVDNYGADCPHGGGSFSGKDPTKVDRSGAYAARYIAKNLVAAGLCKKVQVQIAYAIGVVEPVSLRIEALDNLGPNARYNNEMLTDLIRKMVPLSPKAIIDRFDLRRPIYQETAFDGHFGRDFPWEKIDLAMTLISDVFQTGVDEVGKRK